MALDPLNSNLEQLASKGLNLSLLLKIDSSVHVCALLEHGLISCLHSVYMQYCMRM